MTVYPIQANFSRGELSPRLHARIDIDYYKAGLKTCTNWTALRQGGLRKRPGFQMVKEIKNSAKKARLIPFTFSIQQAYILEFGEGYMRPLVNGGIITTGGGTITGITKANPAVVSLTAHGFANGDKIYITGVGGMVEVNNLEFTVTVVNANSFSIGVNSTAYTTYTSGGLAKKIVEVTTPYLEADLPTLDYAQSADILTVCHQNYQPIEITRSSDTSWTVTTPTFKDGPYLDEPVNITNGVKPSARNVITTGGTYSAGTSSLFDGSESTVNNKAAGSWTIQVTLAASAVCNNYYVQQGGTRSYLRAITAWTFEGFDGTNWIVLHRVADNGSWGSGEKRFFDFVNYASFSQYRMVVTACVGGDNGKNKDVEPPDIMQVAELGWGYNGDYAPTMTLTFDNTSGVNSGAGFSAGDVGRNIRLYASDGKWRWFVITGVTSTTVVTGRMYGYGLPDTDKIFRWKLGAFRSGSWPAKVAFYQSRRVFARAPNEVNTVNFTKTADFYDFGTSQPLVDDDGIRVKLLSGQVNAITWLVEGDKLVMGTGANVRILGKANDNQGFGATNFDQKQQTSNGSKEIKPVTVGSVILYTDYFGKIIREFVYDLNQDGYVGPDVSILSDHLIASGIVEMAYQQVPDSIVWIVCADGSMVSMTYEREQKIVALSRISVAGGDTGTQAYVESVASIPGTYTTVNGKSVGRHEVYAIVRRTIGGVTKRYIERLAAEFEYMATEEGVFLDSSLSYSGTAIGTVYGLNHLIGRTVWALADGQVVRNLTVAANGSITLPNSQTASKIHIGLPYTATLTTLSLNEAGQQDGTGLSRRKLLNDARISVMDALGLKAKGIGSSVTFDVFQRAIDDPVNAQMNLRTGTYPLNFDMSWRDDGQFTLFSDDPLPCTIRGIILAATGEP